MWIATVAILSMCYFSCNQNNDYKKKPTPTPAPTPQTDATLGKPTELTVHGIPVKPEDWSVKVPNNKMSVATGDVEAKFTIGSKKTIAPKVQVQDTPVSLKEGVPVEVTLKVPAEKGVHTGWTKTIKVTRATKDELGELQLASLFVYNKDVKPLDDLQKLSITIPSHIEQIVKEKIEPTFRLNGEKIDVVWNVSPNLPLNIAEEESKEFTLSVPQKDGKYKAWNCKLKITREKKDVSTDPELTLTSLTIADKAIADLSDLDNLSIELPHTVEKVKSNQVEAKFSLNGAEKQVQYTVTPEELELKAGESKNLVITVAKKEGEYKKWEHSVKVTLEDKPADPKLTLTSLTIAGKAITDLSDLDNLSIELPHTVEKVKSNQVEAKFSLNGAEKQVQYTVTPEELELKAGESKNLVITVAKKEGEYKKWEHNVKVKRLKEPEEKTLHMFTFTLKGELISESVNGFYVTIGNEHASVAKENFEYEFRMGLEKIDVDLQISNLPLSLNEGETKEVTLTVPRNPGKYKQWGPHKLKITRDVNNQDPRLILNEKKSKVKGQIKSKLTTGIRLIDETHFEVELDEKKESLNSDDLELVFNKDVELKIAESLPINLELGMPVTLHISVDAKPSVHRAWSGELKITREATLPQLKLESMTICDVPCKIQWIEQYGEKGYVSQVLLPHSIKTVEKSDIQCNFTLNNAPIDVPYNSYVPELQDVEITNGWLFAERKKNTYQEFICVLAVTRMGSVKDGGLDISVHTKEHKTFAIPVNKSGTIISTKSDEAGLTIAQSGNVKITKAKALD